eukprot:CAMPEP_0195126106 /NCGR_PEP_ID=MMETSP0448-20130528/134293_1 /TAXON_ID=66468 /ORGANISM="Heterocapsa triquestra, Strain CCMP 448" /LENGTH=37 /DNA_ID= /DNA_START= /DNA_END= /DNA_ORIENTATION=
MGLSAFGTHRWSACCLQSLARAASRTGQQAGQEAICV